MFLFQFSSFLYLLFLLVGTIGRFIMNTIWVFDFDVNAILDRNKIDFALGIFILLAF